MEAAAAGSPGRGRCRQHLPLGSGRQPPAARGQAEGRQEALLTEQRLSVRQLARIEELRAFQRTVEHVGHLVAELDGSRGAAASVHERLLTAISRELSQLRQRALAAGVGGVDQQAGALAVLARAGIGLNFKIRALADGLASLDTELDLELKRATRPPPARPKQP